MQDRKNAGTTATMPAMSSIFLNVVYNNNIMLSMLIQRFNSALVMDSFCFPDISQLNLRHQ